VLTDGTQASIRTFAFIVSATMSAQLGAFKVPAVDNEPMKTYAPGSLEREFLQAAIAQMEQELPFEVPIIINGDQVRFRLHMSATYYSG